MTNVIRKFYAYRDNKTGHDHLHSARPFCTKAAAYGGVIKYNRTVPLTAEEQEAHLRDRGFRSTWRYRTKDELKAWVAENFTLIEYDLVERGPVSG